MDLKDQIEVFFNDKDIAVDAFLKIQQIVERCISAEQERDQLRQRIEASEKQEPVKYEFKCNDGKWYGFDSDKHYRNTVDSGEFEIRALYALPPMSKEDNTLLDQANRCAEQLKDWPDWRKNSAMKIPEHAQIKDLPPTADKE